MTKHYRYCGLVLKSELDMPELPTVSDAGVVVDLTIRFAEVPVHLPNAVHRTHTYEHDGVGALWRLDGVARFRVSEGGRTIDVDPVPGVDFASVRVFLLQPLFALASVLRGDWLLAGAAVAREGRVFALVGPSASGKSTAAAILLSQGYQLVSDSLIRITRDESGRMLAHPQAPWLWLWPDAIHFHGLQSKALEQLRPCSTLQRIGFSTVECALPLERIAVLSSRRCDSLCLRQTAIKPSAHAFALLLHYTAGATWLATLGSAQRKLFHFGVQVASRTVLEQLDIPMRNEKFKPLFNRLSGW